MYCATQSNVGMGKGVCMCVIIKQISSTQILTCVKSFLSRDGRIADGTVRHLGVERPFSS